MKVILKVDMETLGEIGDIVDVKPGYARNYLFPRNLALEINKHNLEMMKARKKKVQKKLELEKLSAQEQKPKLEEITLTFERKAGETGALFGSVTVSDIEKKLEELGVKIEKKKFHLEEPIKRLGNHVCKIKLFKDVEAELKIVVTAEGGEEEVEKEKEVEKEEVKEEVEEVKEEVEKEEVEEVKEEVEEIEEEVKEEVKEEVVVEEAEKEEVKEVEEEVEEIEEEEAKEEVVEEEVEKEEIKEEVVEKEIEEEIKEEEVKEDVEEKKVEVEEEATAEAEEEVKEEEGQDQKQEQE